MALLIFFYIYTLGIKDPEGFWANHYYIIIVVINRTRSTLKALNFCFGKIALA